MYPGRKSNEFDWNEAAADLAERAIVPRLAPVNQIISIAWAVAILIGLARIGLALR